MDLSSELISQFAKITNDTKKEKTESTVYGTTVELDGRIYVKLDGSDRLTPVETTTAVTGDERVMVTIKDHSATITGNISSPAAKDNEVKELGNKIDEFDTIVADKVKAETAEIESAIITKLDGKYATFESLDATYASIKSLEAAEGEIGELKADNVEIKEKLTARDAEINQLKANSLTVEVADAKYATIENLEGLNADFNSLESTYADFVEVTTNSFEALEAEIAELDVESLNAKYANIDFSNIGKAAMENFYANSGLIKNVVVGDQTITGELVGVTISGDRIIGGSIVADKLVIKGDDGIYYKLNAEGGATAEQLATEEYQNGLHGSNIIANSITAEKIKVDDLVAFDATIGNFNIGDNSIYSGAKASVDNTTRGIYMDTDGQLNFGDSNNYLKFYKDQNGNYKLDISASSLKFGTSGQNVEDAINDVQNSVNNIQVDSNSTNSASGNTPIIINDSADGKVIDLKVYGKTTQDGTPTPDAPIDLVSVGDSGSFNVDVYGKNLIDIKDKPTDTDFNIDIPINIKKGTPLTHSIITYGGILGGITNGSGYAVRAVWGDYSKGEYEIIGVGTTLTHDCRSIRIAFAASLFSSRGGTATSYSIQVEVGEVATDFEPYKPKQTLSLPYHLRGVGDAKDNIDFERGVYVQRFAETTFNGSENWTANGSNQGYGLVMNNVGGDTTGANASNVMCDRLVAKEQAAVFSGYATNIISTRGDISKIYVRVDSTITTVALLKEWLASNPLTVVYPLATPIEIPLTEQVLSEYAKLRTYEPNTTLIADSSPNMYVEYFRNTEDGKKLAKNYDALQSSASNAQTAANNALNTANNIQVGGRNYVLDSDKELNGNNTLDFYIPENLQSVLAGKEVIVSFDAKADNTDSTHDIDFYFRSNNITGTYSPVIKLNGVYQRFSHTLSFPTDLSEVYWVRFRGNTYVGNISNANPTGGNFFIKNVKVELGNKATDWTPAPEDVDADIDNVQSNVDNNAQKIVEAESNIEQLSNQISTLVRDSSGNSLMTQTSTGWTFSMGDFEATLNNLLAHVKIGTYNGQPCLELVVDEAKQKLMLTNTKISFMESDTTAAYISGNTMNIDHAQIDNGLSIGSGYKWAEDSDDILNLIYQ